jgi:hypothetical protein
MALWCNGVLWMDHLSLKFAEQSALRMVDSCTDLEQLKPLTRSLVKGHFEAKAPICLLLEQQIEALGRDRCEGCPSVFGTDQAPAS